MLEPLKPFTRNLRGKRNSALVSVSTAWHCADTLVATIHPAQGTENKVTHKPNLGILRSQAPLFFFPRRSLEPINPAVTIKSDQIIVTI